MDEVNSREIKRGNPAAFLLLLAPAWIAYRGYMDLKPFLDKSAHSTWNYIDLGLTTIVLVLVTTYVVKRLAIRWEILTQGKEITLIRNRRELFRGEAGDLKVRGYDYGMLQLETPEGNVFAFPAFGAMARFVRTEGTDMPTR
jgi:hypothetical protein